VKKPPPPPASPRAEPPPALEFEDKEILPGQVLALLSESTAVGRSLRNQHLRDLLVEIDSAAQPVPLLRTAMQIPIFVEFADACLEVCGLRPDVEAGSARKP